MMIKTLKAFVHSLLPIAVLTLNLLPIAAQQTLGLSLDSCINIAHRNSLSVTRALLNKENTQTDLSSAQSKFLPQISAGINQGFDFGRSQDNTGVYVDRSSMATSFGLSAGINLFSGLSHTHGLKAAKLGGEVSSLDVDRVRNDLTLQIAGLYYNVLFKREIRHIAQAQVALTKEQLARTTDLVEAGKWSDSKTYEMQAQLAKEELSLSRAENDIALALLDLAQAMNITTEGLSPSSPSIDNLVAQATAHIQPAAQTYQTALEWLPQIRMAELTIAQAALHIASARSGYLPSLDLSMGYNNGYYYNFGKQYETLNRSFSDQWKQNGRSSIGLSLRIPLFDAFATRDQVRRARTSEKLARLDLSDKKLQLYKEIQQAYLNATNAAGQIAAAERALAAARRAFEAAELQFEAGKIGAYEYSDAKTKLSIAEIDLLQAKYDFVYKASILKFYSSTEK